MQSARPQRRQIAIWAIRILGVAALIYWIFYWFSLREERTLHQADHAQILSNAILSGDVNGVFKYTDRAEKEGGLSKRQLSGLLNWLDDCLDGWTPLDRPGEIQRGVDLGLYTRHLQHESGDFEPFTVPVMLSPDGNKTDSVVQTIIRLGVRSKYRNELLPAELDQQHPGFQQLRMAYGVRQETSNLARIGIHTIYHRQRDPISVGDYALRQERRAQQMLEDSR